MKKTIKELADELGVSKTAVRKYMTSEFRSEHTSVTDGNIIVIDSIGCKFIAESIRKPPETGSNQFSETTENQSLRDLREEVAFLREQLRAANKQIDAKDQQISDLTAANKELAQSINADRRNELAGTLKDLLPEGDPAASPETLVDLDPSVQVPPKERFGARAKKAWRDLWGK